MQAGTPNAPARARYRVQGGLPRRLRVRDERTYLLFVRSFGKMSFVSQTQDAHARSVTFLTDDSVHLRGIYWEPRENGHTSVLLLHDFRSDRSVWEPYIPAFRSRGWGVLAVDLRGHGESVRQDMRADLLQPSETDLRSPLSYPNDVRAALAFLARQPKSDAG